MDELSSRNERGKISSSQKFPIVGTISLIVIIIVIVIGGGVFLRQGDKSRNNKEVPQQERQSKEALDPIPFEEPTNVFAWSFDDTVLNVQLINHTTKQQVKSVSIQTNLPITEAPYTLRNDLVQYNDPSETILFTVNNRENGLDGPTVVDPGLDFCHAIFATGFTGKQPTRIWSDKECSLVSWIVHPKKPEVYIMARDASNDTHGTLYVVDIVNSRPIKSIGRSIAPSGLALNQATGEIAFAHWLGNMHFRGTKRSFIEITKFNPYSNEGYNPIFIDETFENFQYLDDIQNLSPNFRFFPYQFGYIDIETGDNFPIGAFAGDGLKHSKIWWSADTLKMLFVTEQGLNIYDRVSQTLKPLSVSSDLGAPKQWAPSQKYLLFSSYVDDVQVWDSETENFIKLTEGFQPDGASWAY